jgi:hypothetical protein
MPKIFRGGEGRDGLKMAAEGAHIVCRRRIHLTGVRSYHRRGRIAPCDSGDRTIARKERSHYLIDTSVPKPARGGSAESRERRYRGEAMRK